MARPKSTCKKVVCNENMAGNEFTSGVYCTSMHVQCQYSNTMIK